jgi:hypothetical protein
MVGEGELNIVFVDSENVAKFGALQFLQQRGHVGQYLLEKVERGVSHIEDYYFNKTKKQCSIL